jgi:hypothetical protein
MEQIQRLELPLLFWKKAVFFVWRRLFIERLFHGVAGVRRRRVVEREAEVGGGALVKHSFILI